MSARRASLITIITLTLLGTGCNKANKPALNLPERAEQTSIGIGLLPYKKDGKWGYINPQRKFQIKPIYDDAEEFSEDRAVVKRGSRWLVIDSKGETVFEFKDGLEPNGSYYSSLHFKQGRLPVLKKKKKYGFVDQNGKLVVKPRYDFVGAFSEGLALVGREINIDKNLCGYINRAGRLVIAIKYSDCSNFSRGLAAVEKRRKYFYIKKNGSRAFSFRADWAGPFAKDGLAPVAFKQRKKDTMLSHSGPIDSAIIDTRGRKVKELIFDSAGEIIDGCFSASIPVKVNLGGSLSKVLGEVDGLSSVLMSAGEFGGRVTEPEIGIYVKNLGNCMANLSKYDDDTCRVVGSGGRFTISRFFSNVNCGNKFIDDLLAVYSENEVAYVNSQGRMVVGWQ